MTNIIVRQGPEGSVQIWDGDHLLGIGATFEAAQADAQEILQAMHLDVCLLRKPEWATRQEEQVAAILEQLS